jgi:Multicopper oxidase
MFNKITQKYYLNRRKFIQGTSLLSGLVVGSGIHGLISSCSRQSSVSETPQKSPETTSSKANFIPDVEINLKALPKIVAILPGQMTQVWSYAAELVKGDPASLKAIPDSYLGPIIHIHGVKFQVISREVLPELAAGWQTVKDGYVDDGFKDTVMVMPGEKVKLLMKFEKYSGLFAYHCHTLEHEDAGMMRNYRVNG